MTENIRNTTGNGNYGCGIFIDLKVHLIQKILFFLMKYHIIYFTHYVFYRLKKKKINPITKLTNKTIKNIFSFAL